MTSPFSESAVALVMLLPALCRSETSLATTSPLAFFHGPLPMRSLALTAGWPSAACVDRYARQVFAPAPAACASDWQCRSAPATPPRSPPLPGPLLVRKKLVSADCAKAGGAATTASAKHAAEVSLTNARIEFLPIVLVTLQPDQPGAHAIIPFPRRKGDSAKQKRRGKTAALASSWCGDQLVCWIAESSQFPPRWRTKVQTSVTSVG